MADAIIEKQTEYVAEQEEHQKHISENYKKLLDSASPALKEREEERPAPAPAYTAPEPAKAASNAQAFVPVADNAARIRDYNAYRVPAGQRTLFDSAPAASEELVMSVPATAAAPATATITEDSEDALPTPTTMAMLNRVEEAEERDEIPTVGFFATLSIKLKVALTVVAAAILVAVAIIFINTSVLRSMDARINSERSSLRELQEQYREVQQRIEEATDPDSIAAWAEQNGMVKD